MSASMIEQHILAASHIAYLPVDRALAIQGVGGDRGLAEALGVQVGQPLLAALPELYGSEEDLADLLAGRLDRIYLPEVNRDRPAGATRYLDLLTLPHAGPDGQIVGLIQVITDVSERAAGLQIRAQQRNEYRLLKEQVSQQNIDLARTNAELRRATRMKDEFLAGISHEIRTPLTAILGLAEVTRAGLAGPLTALQVENLNGIEASGRHLLNLINDFLDIAKIEAGRLELEAGPTGVAEVCEAALRMVADIARRQRIHLTSQLSDAVSLIYADERRLRQVLINLLSNAIKFTPPGGQVGLDLHADPEGECARFTVWDTGVGIAAADVGRLFQPFAQIAGEHQRGQQGSGLGLALVAQLVELHGGGISLESEPGRGSRFSVALPWSPDRERALREMLLGNAGPDLADPLPMPQAARRALLLVEDDQATAQLLIGYLERCGYQVAHAGSAEEALAYVRAQLPELVITDVRLQGMDGLGLIRRLRGTVATRAIPIVALTALAMPGDHQACLEAGASAYLSKPLPLRRLAATIAELLG